AAGGDPLSDDGNLRALVGEVAEAERRCDRGDAYQARRPDPAHAPRHPGCVPESLGRNRQGGVGEESVLQESARFAARLCREGGAREALHVSAVLVCGQLLLARNDETNPPDRGNGDEEHKEATPYAERKKRAVTAFL